ncbi:hypothetical protein L208DRAFT_1252839 [Tricholoma matsutake]|nr:hypothetical protein L208DRAFT_1252839 [Tricholoma matsutake 945]
MLHSISLSILSALTSLLLLNDVPPIPLSPVLLHYFIHNLELDAISPNLLGTWYPDLRKLIQDWIAIGPNSDIEVFASHFITYHDTQISLLAIQDEHTHQSLACKMLYRAVVGPAQLDHPDIQAFLHGFSLPCHNGFCFTDFVKCVEGSSEILFSILWTSNITSPADLIPYLHTRPSSSNVAHQLAAAVPNPLMTFSFIIGWFLQGTGVPCPVLFEE